MSGSHFISSFQRATVFVNPAAGSGRGARSVSKIQQIFKTRCRAVNFQTTASVQELEAGARDALERKSDLLVVLGGDGTFQALVNATYGADIVLGVLPGGGGNDFADALGLPVDPVAAAAAILAGTPRSVDLARARTADGRERLYVGGGGLGIDADAARHASNRYRRFPGRWRYILSALHALGSYRGLQVRAEFPDSDLPAIERNALLAAVLNTPSYGAKIRLAPVAHIDDGCLDVAMVEYRNAAAALALLPGLVTTGELRTRRIKRALARKIRLSANRYCLFHGDGEIQGPAPVEIEVVPRAVRVLAPAASDAVQPQ